ncbi:MAG: DUF2442 domain-containing protein [Chloroflexota bacterium]|nr:DUF2442 domain-containing protein [Chloroflexota bacterium]
MPNTLNRPTDVEARAGHRLWLRYIDGTDGEVDLSHLAGRGVFKLWDSPGCFETARIAPTGGIAWGDDVELCPDALFLRLTGKALADVMPAAQHSAEIA